MAVKGRLTKEGEGKTQADMLRKDPEEFKNVNLGSRELNYRDVFSTVKIFSSMKAHKILTQNHSNALKCLTTNFPKN